SLRPTRFSSHSSGPSPAQHSFPTRRSSDLTVTELPGYLNGQPHEQVERDGVHYLLLGTAHVSRESVEAVRDAIGSGQFDVVAVEDRKSTRLNSSHVKISYAVFCLKKKTTAL